MKAHSSQSQMFQPLASKEALYQNLQQLTGQVSLLKENWSYPQNDTQAPLIISRNVLNHSKFHTRIELLGRDPKAKGSQPRYRSMAVIDIDRRNKLAWTVDQKGKRHPSMEGLNKVLASAVQAKEHLEKRALQQKEKQKRLEREHALQRKKHQEQLEKRALQQKEKQKRLEREHALQRKKHQEQLEQKRVLQEKERSLRKQRIKAARTRIEQKRQLSEEITLPHDSKTRTHDILHRESLYRRLEGTFGDLRNYSREVVIGGDTAHHPESSADLVFRCVEKHENKGLFSLSTQNSRNGKVSRTLVAYFLVDFVTFKAQAAPALAFFKGAYTLSLRSFEHVRSAREKRPERTSMLGDLLAWPKNLSSRHAPQQAYYPSLLKVGVDPQQFESVPRRFLKPHDRVGLFCNVASAGMLKQISSRYQVPQAKRDKFTLDFPDGRQLTVTVDGLHENETARETLNQYLTSKRKLRRKRSPQNLPDVVKPQSTKSRSEETSLKLSEIKPRKEKPVRKMRFRY